MTSRLVSLRSGPFKSWSMQTWVSLFKSGNSVALPTGGGKVSLLNPSEPCWFSSRRFALWTLQELEHADMGQSIQKWQLSSFTTWRWESFTFEAFRTLFDDFSSRFALWTLQELEHAGVGQSL